MAEKEFNVKDEYLKLQKVYNLPDFNNLNNNFEISHLEKKDFLIRNIRRRIYDRIVYFCRVIETIIMQTGQNPLAAYESGFFDEETRDNMSALHRKLMVFERQAMYLEISPNEKVDADFIIKLNNLWPEIIPEIGKIIRIMENAWMSELKEEDQKYFG